MKKVKKCYKN